MSRVAIGRTGFQNTIVEIGLKKKCRMTLGSIARRYCEQCDTQGLSNRLGNGISNGPASAF